MKVYTVIQVFQGEGSIAAQGLNRKKVFGEFQDKVKKYLDAGYEDYDGFDENSTEFHSDNMEITFNEKDIPEIDDEIYRASVYGAG